LLTPIGSAPAAVGCMENNSAPTPNWGSLKGIEPIVVASVGDELVKMKEKLRSEVKKERGTI
jgi:hypothetical protein